MAPMMQDTPPSLRGVVAALATMLALGPLACSDADRTRWSARFGSAESQYSMGERHLSGRGVEADPELALEWFEDAAAQGHFQSQMRLVELYEERDAAGDADRALTWLKAAAEGGDPEAQFLYGKKLTEAGESSAGSIWIDKAADAEHPAAQVVKARQLAREGGDAAQVIRLLQAAAQKGDPDGAFELARVAEGGAVSMTEEEITKLLLVAAEEGHAGAQFAMGERYTHAKGVEQDYREAVKWYRKSAEQEFASAQEALGIMYQAGYGVDPSPGEAANWYRLAADQGRAAAQNQLGSMYAQGLLADEETADRIAMFTAAGGNRDEDLAKLGEIARKNNDRRAVEWYEKAIAQDFSPAMINLAKLIEEGRAPGREPEEAIALFRRSAELGNPIGQSQMAVRLSRGVGVERDVAASLAMLEESARSGHAPAQMALASAYLRGIDGAEPDREKAAHWYGVAAKAGVPEAQAPYASMLVGGIGVPQDEKMALELFEAAAERGDPAAEYSLGVLYAEGRAGLEANPRTAAMWWKRAAKQGQPQAQARLGVALIREQGVSRSLVEAYAWLAASGLEEAKPWVQTLEKEMPDLMLTRAKKLAEKRRAIREAAPEEVVDADAALQ